jgi:hypothetical protein
MSIGYFPKELGREAANRAAALKGKPAEKVPSPRRSVIPVSSSILAYQSPLYIDIVFEQDTQPKRHHVI